MLRNRINALKVYQELPLPDFGPSLDGLDVDKLTIYLPTSNTAQNSWEDVPQDILQTFEALGIPESERVGLAGVGAQYDSEIIYHNIQQTVAAKGVIYDSLENVIRGKYDNQSQSFSQLVREKFMKLVPVDLHKFAALHAAVWSGGSFVYVPEGVEVEIPLQSYFRFNAPGAGQFEHTLIIADKNSRLHFIEGCSAPKYNMANLHAGCVEIYVGEGAHVRYSTVENWSRNMYNLNTKRAVVEKDGSIEWVSGSFGSKVSYLYPTSILAGENSRADFTGVSFASAGQELDTGASVIHLAKNTHSVINSRSIAKDGGRSNFRSYVKVAAPGAKSAISCDSIILDEQSHSDTIPKLEILSSDANVGHEARIGRIDDEAIFYLQSRGLSEASAKSTIVSGFVEPIAKELPLEYAAEMNDLIDLEMRPDSISDIVAGEPA